MLIEIMFWLMLAFGVFVIALQILGILGDIFNL